MVGIGRRQATDQVVRPAQAARPGGHRRDTIDGPCPVEVQDLRGGATPQPTSNALPAPRALSKIVRRFMLRSLWLGGLRHYLRF